MSNQYEKRVFGLSVVVIIAGSFLGLRAAQLQVVESTHWSYRAQEVHTRHALLPPVRGRILDRTGDVELARNRTEWDVHVVYWYFTEPAAVQQRLAWYPPPSGFYTPTERRALDDLLAALVRERDVLFGGTIYSRFVDTWERRHAHPLLRRELDRILALLATRLGVEAQVLRMKFDAVEARVNLLMGADGRPSNDNYAMIRNLGWNPLEWDDLARRERREVPEAAWTLQDNPLILATGIDRITAEQLLSLDILFPGLSAEPTHHREYPEGALLSHTLGYLRQTDRIGFTPTDAEHTDIWYSPTVQRLLAQAGQDVGVAGLSQWYPEEEGFRRRFARTIYSTPVGQTGLERAVNRRLFGDFGLAISSEDVRGRTVAMLHDQAPHAGEDLRLTIDVGVQRVAEQALRELWEREGNPGAVVAIDVQTGEILAIASSPGLDLDRLMGDSDEDRAYQREAFAVDASGSPQLNRATQGQPSPGSVFKILTAIAAIEEGVLHGPNYDQAEMCTGKWSVAEDWNQRGYTCHASSGGCRRHHSVVSAIEKSCNVFFHDVGHRLGYALMREWGARFGFGEPTGVELPEARCWIPGRDGSRVNRLFPLPSDSMLRGEPALVAIGQGRLQTTPLQVARFMATVAARGRMTTPHLCLDDPDSFPVTELPVSDTTWDLIHRGMRDVVFGPHGTARNLHVLQDWHVAGKTGTAQTGRTRDGSDLHYSWFAGFAPYEAPRVAFAVYVEDTLDSGGTAAGPIAEALVESVAQSELYREHFALTCGR